MSSSILIVEDETALRELYVTLFGFEKFQVYHASNGKAAMQQLASVSPDVILLDVMMPIMNGLEFLEQANLSATHPDTKVLVLSNLSDPKTLDRITELGANKYMLKASVSPGNLVKAVRELIDSGK